MNANQPVVRRMIIDSLYFWVKEMHVDGFRFDLASILSRDENGKPLKNPPVLWDIESDPVLAGTKLIAEAWDAAGLYQVGSFIGDNWKEWNGMFRDDIRSFMRGYEGYISKFVSRILGSPDVYGHENREAEQSINFITCHDGFTLNDLVSYNSKHNEANGEENRDGCNENFSWNCGVEGPNDEPAIDALRNRQVKNFLTLTLLSVGAPMILMGDEVRRTQNGNNNAYCHDNEITWFNWKLVDNHADIHRFTKILLKYRLLRDTTREEYSMSLMQLMNRNLITWHGVKLFSPDWSYNSHSIAFSVRSLSGNLYMHFMINAYIGSLEFELPEYIEQRRCFWKRWIDTSLESPDDISELSETYGYLKKCTTFIGIPWQFYRSEVSLFKFTGRSSGILLHLTSLPGKYGSGDLGPDAYEFVELLERAGQSWWQMLPVGPPGSAPAFSPYDSCSGFAGNPYFVSLSLLLQEGLLKSEDINRPAEFSGSRVNYPAVHKYRDKTLRLAFKNFKDLGDKQKHGFNRFCDKNAYWLEDFALFMALKISSGGKPWTVWDEDIRTRKPDALEFGPQEPVR